MDMAGHALVVPEAPNWRFAENSWLLVAPPLISLYDAADPTSETKAHLASVHRGYVHRLPLLLQSAHGGVHRRQRAREDIHLCLARHHHSHEFPNRA